MIRSNALLRLATGLVLALALATNLGCGLYVNSDPPVTTGPPPAPPPIDPPAPPGQPAPLPPSGGVPPPAQGCVSSVDAPELVCSRCAGDPPGAAAECMAARCVVDGDCLSCTDPKGRVARDCSMSYGLYSQGGFSGSANAQHNFAACTFHFGAPNSAGTTCNYPGPASCEVTEVSDAHCLTCDFPDGTSSGQCVAAGDPLPDPLVGRPNDLPGPGGCVSELGEDGTVACTTCMNADLSATRSCRFPAIDECDIFAGADAPGRCIGTCTLVDGHREQLCESPSGLHLMP